MNGDSMMVEPFTVWLTGLSGSGKTTLAHAAEARLRALGLTNVTILDGDELRKTLSADLGFTKEDRDEHIRRVYRLCARSMGEGKTCLVAVISPYRSIRDEARQALRRFAEVFVRCPLEVLIQRDHKGLYKKALAGEIPLFTGVSDPYEEPLTPEVLVDTHRLTVDQSVDVILTALRRLGYLPLGATHSVVP